MTRRYGRSLRGERLRDKIPRNQGVNQTLVCALQLAGPVAAFVFEGAVNGDAFVWYTENILCPTIEEGDTIFLDNLSFHYRDEVTFLIEDKGEEVIYLPAYSPDLNPIEMLFSKVKALIRGVALRSLPELWKAVWEALDTITAEVSVGSVFPIQVHSFTSCSNRRT